jgi:hypothetical protein
MRRALLTEKAIRKGLSSLREEWGFVAMLLLGVKRVTSR